MNHQYVMSPSHSTTPPPTSRYGLPGPQPANPSGKRGAGGIRRVGVVGVGVRLGFGGFGVGVGTRSSVGATVGVGFKACVGSSSTSTLQPLIVSTPTTSHELSLSRTRPSCENTS